MIMTSCILNLFRFHSFSLSLCRSSSAFVWMCVCLFWKGKDSIFSSFTFETTLSLRYRFLLRVSILYFIWCLQQFTFILFFFVPARSFALFNCNDFSCNIFQLKNTQIKRTEQKPSAKNEPKSNIIIIM